MYNKTAQRKDINRVVHINKVYVLIFYLEGGQFYIRLENNLKG